MKNYRLAALAAALCLGAAAPAYAELQSIGSVTVSNTNDRDTRSFDLGGPVDSLNLRAAGSNIECRDVMATFGNGMTRQVFSGRLYVDRVVNVDLPGQNRDVRRLSFHCRAQERDGGVIRIAADVGSHRDEWRRNPNFARVWAHVFNWGSDTLNDWQYLGQVDFVGRHDKDNAFGGWRGRSSTSIALKPLNANARCSRITARFGNGDVADLKVDMGDFMRQGQFYKIDVPGRRNIAGLTLRCRATNADRVTMQIYSGK